MIQNSISEKLSIVIPVYNEEENIALLVGRVEGALHSIDYEIILVDDGSTDNTRQEVKKLNNPNVVLIELKKNYGQSLALASGIDYATGDYIITMDGDLQNDPDDILIMLHKAKTEDWDVVTGIRQKRQDNLVRTFPSKIANWIIRKSTHLDIQDHGCALKVFNKETARELNLYGEMHRYITLLAFLNGARITEVKVKHHQRQFGKSKYGLGRTTKVINDLILLLFQRKYLQKPIHLFGNIGLLSFVTGSIMLVYLLISKFGFGEDIGNRPLLILGILLMFVGVQFFTTGFIIDLQMRTYFESQQKKPYKIRKIFIGESEVKKEFTYHP
ncbi:glycosyltransferase family 2 protein [Moheibacter sediminis]|uniref:Glycosyltransferase involved in cell wall bisynthesis n=1 Tax=Moheibacter sediminis TaxID=1434700 RepID=A0A1W1ZKI0_9FLAO|nr:glycosyltransferase family 2 protein [Moheibacter sediminis]SMC49060.1 Glycosyltransferase involved in cell wall bisynthesis [Moheibacter sediminis]